MIDEADDHYSHLIFDEDQDRPPTEIHITIEGIYLPDAEYVKREVIRAIAATIGGALPIRSADHDGPPR